MKSWIFHQIVLKTEIQIFVRWTKWSFWCSTKNLHNPCHFSKESSAWVFVIVSFFKNILWWVHSSGLLQSSIKSAISSLHSMYYYVLTNTSFWGVSFTITWLPNTYLCSAHSITIANILRLGDLCDSFISFDEFCLMKGFVQYWVWIL